MYDPNFGFFAPNNFKSLGLPNLSTVSATWWMLFQRHVVRTTTYTKCIFKIIVAHQNVLIYYL